MPENRDAAGPALLVFYFFQYLAVRTVAAFVIGLPEFLVRGALASLVPFLHMVDTRHRHRARAHLANAGYSKGDSRILARRVFSHFAASFLESLLMRRKITALTWRKFVRLENWDLMDEALARNRGVLCIGCHEGNWELAGVVTTLLGLSHTTIARPFANPWLDAWLNGGLRSSEGRRMAKQEGGIRELMRALRDNRIGVLLADQNAGRDGVFVPFFGQPASTWGTPATLSLRTGATILPFYTYREAPNRYVVGFHRDAPPAPTGDTDADVRALTAWFTALFERSIRLHPDQWVWPHRRWRSLPGRSRQERAVASEAPAD